MKKKKCSVQLLPYFPKGCFSVAPGKDDCVAEGPFFLRLVSHDRGQLGLNVTVSLVYCFLLGIRTCECAKGVCLLQNKNKKINKEKHREFRKSGRKVDEIEVVYKLHSSCV